MTAPRRPKGEDGFSMVMVLGVLAVVAALSAVAFTNATGDFLPRKQSQDRKSAYAAAEAGLAFYLSRLNQDPDYWALCDGGSRPSPKEQNPVNQAWNGAGTDPRRYRHVPDGTPDVADNTTAYTVELLPAPGAPSCTTGANAQASMIDALTGRMRIRVTGVVGVQLDPSTGRLRTKPGTGQKRSIVISLRRRGFLDYLYFTDYETLDPAAYGPFEGRANAECRKYRMGATQRGSICQEIQFADDDEIKGPFHTNDDILTCNTPTFGRDRNDRVEISGPGYRNICGTGPPDVKGTYATGVPQLSVPSSNAKLTERANLVFTGTTRLTFNDAGTVTIENASQTPNPRTIPVPANSVIHVKNGAGCGAGVSPIIQDYTEPAGCANVYVKGRYNQNLTLVSDKDIIVNGNICRLGSGADCKGSAGSDVLLGLIATNFVRVYHPVVNRLYSNGIPYDCTNGPGIIKDVRIEAAILSLEHSFIVDNYICGAPLGDLTVKGAIAQRFRGPVGATDSRGLHGFIKDYLYDDRFKFRNPPFFLDPEKAGWRTLRTNEQVPAR